MPKRPSHAELQELLGAYALHALDEQETELVADHLRECPRCRAEAEVHRATAALLASEGTDAPAGVWERIAKELNGTQPPVALAFVRRQRAVLRRALSVVAVAAVVAIGLLAWQGARLDDRTQDLKDSLAQNDGTQAALAAFTEPTARRVQLVSPDGLVVVPSVLLSDGRGYLMADRLPRLGNGRTYQLWSIGEGRRVSLGILGRNPTVVAFTADANLEVLVVTDEAAPGVAGTDRPPVVSGHPG